MGSVYQIRLADELNPSPLHAVLVWAEAIASPFEAHDPPPLLADMLDRASRQPDELLPEDRKRAVRQMLRHGKYKPSGRGKPASEFLLRAATEGQFPQISGPVDVNNAISLASGFPGSIFDASLSGKELLVRRGLAGESYVFNASGQTIDLTDLLLVCRRVDGEWVPCGNPVKDSQETKIQNTTEDVLGVLYVPAVEPREHVECWAEHFSNLLGAHCGAKRCGWQIAWNDRTVTEEAHGG